MSSLHAVAFIRDIHMHIYAVTNLLMLFFWIKLIMKMAKYLAESMFSPLISFDVLNLEVFSRETQAVVQIICVVRLR